MNRILQYYFYLKYYTRKGFGSFLRLSIFFHIALFGFSFLCNTKKETPKIIQIQIVKNKIIPKKDLYPQKKSVSKKILNPVKKKKSSKKKTKVKKEIQKKIITKPIQDKILIAKKSPVKKISEELIARNLDIYEKLEKKALEHYGKHDDIQWEKGTHSKQLLWIPKIDYPKKYVEQSIQASVKLKIYVNSQGEVTSVMVVESSGYLRLDVSAQKALRRAKFSKNKKTDIGIIEIKFRIR